MKKSILGTLKWSMMAFGLCMGIVFPIYANYFVTWKEGMVGYFVAGAVGAGIIVGLVNHYFVKYILVKRLMDISGFADAIHMGNISVTLAVDSNDAVGDIVRRLNASIVTLRESISEFRRFSNELFSMLEGNGNARSRGFFGIVKNLSESEQNLAKSSAEEKKLSTEGRDKINGIRTELNQTNTLMKELRIVNSKLVEKSSAINKNVKAIEEIASKINLISMNATVESARAGEQGRSFGEVAKEIQSLSVTSTNTAKSIRDMISEITSEIQETTRSIDDLEISIENNVREIGHSEELFEKISMLIASSDNNINQTLHSIEEISSSSGRLSQIADNMKNITDSFQLE